MATCITMQCPGLCGKAHGPHTGSPAWILLDDLFSDYEDYNGGYAGDPVRIVLELCREADIDPTPGPNNEADRVADDDPAVQAEARALATARGYLMMVAPDLCRELDDGASERAQGPP